MVAVGQQIEIKGQMWTIQSLDTCDAFPLVKRHNAEIGVLGYAVVTFQGPRKRRESLARLRTDGSFEKFI